MTFTARCRLSLGALAAAAVVSPLAVATAAHADTVDVVSAATSSTPSDAVVPELVVDPVGSLDLTATSPSKRSLTTAQAPAFPLASTFTLHSSPSSALTIYLDFDGATIGATAYPDATEGRQPAWSTDSDTSTFSDSERTQVQDIWQSVAEDYAPFDVDVTTEEPAAARITRDSAADQSYGTRVLITGSRTVRTTADQAVCATTCGGLAYTGAFDTTYSHDQYQPAWVFPQNLGDTSKSIAESAAHEAGHTLGLRHDGNASAEYETGHANWGPIMGGPYNVPVTQWSKGEYSGANNGEDDLAVIASHGPARRFDDYTGSVTGAGGIPAASGSPAATSIISDQADVDTFGLGSCTGTVSVNAAPAARYGADLDIRVRILDAAGTVLASNDAVTASYRSDYSSGLDASTSTAVTTATSLFVSVEGVGAGTNASTGYSDYGSLGRYSLSATGSCSGALPPAPIAAPVAASVAKTATSTSAPAATTLGVRTAPSLRGRSTVGSTLKVTAGSYDRPAATAVRWYAGGKPVGKGANLRVTPSRVGQQITARVTVKAAGLPAVVVRLNSKSVQRAAQR